MQFPKIIQGGMGAGVSNWRLAQAVSRLGQLGVVSSTALDQILVRRLGDGDPDGHMKIGFDMFPFQEMAKRVWREYFVPEGKAPDAPYKATPMHTRNDARKLVELCILSNFVEVTLARLGHDNAVGINLLEKVQVVHLPSLYGAMLAGAGYVLMGAGIPLHIPGVLDKLALHQPVEYKLSVAGAPSDLDTQLRFDPRDYMEGDLPALNRPNFLAIISSNTLATTMLKRGSGKTNGFVVEKHTAGGHNAPPRGKTQISETGEPVYGERDQVNLEALSELGVPFWLAGGYNTPEKLKEAQAAGAQGIQVGSVFALSAESGLREDLKQQLLDQVVAEKAKVFTDPLASPTGFPFKVALLEGTLSGDTEYEARTRVCDLGYLREGYVTPKGAIGYRCAAENIDAFLAKGGTIEETVGRKCLCNALMANVGYGQIRPDGRQEQPLLTAGDGLNEAARFLPVGQSRYTAADVVQILLGEKPEARVLAAAEAGHA